MGNEFKCGCRVSAGHWFLCKRHESVFIDMLHKPETNTVSDIVQDKQGKTIKYVNERPMKEA